MLPDEMDELITLYYIFVVTCKGLMYWILKSHMNF